VASINERNELIKIRRRHRSVFSETHISHVLFAPLIEPDPIEADGVDSDIVPHQYIPSRSSSINASTTDESSLSSSPESNSFIAAVSPSGYSETHLGRSRSESMSSACKVLR
jgi:hypothetical protein